MIIKKEETGIVLNKKTGHQHEIGRKLIIQLLTGYSKDDYEIIEASDEIKSEVVQLVEEKDVHKKILGKIKLSSSKEDLVKEAKELGIKSAHLMSIEKLHKKIKEAK